MKVRTFFATLALFLIAFHLGIVMISVATFKDVVRQAEEKSVSEHYFIVAALTKDLHAVASRDTDIESAAGSLLQPYSYWAREKQVKLALYKDNRFVYSNWPDRPREIGYTEPPEDGSRLVSVQKADGRTFVTVSGTLPAPYDAYTLLYFYDLTDAIAAWRQTKNLLFGTGALLSVLLATGLYVLLSRIFQPLSQISQISRKIASGAYDTRLPVSGHDELAEMARSFNHMAVEIQRQMTELKAAAEKKQQFVDNFAHELRTPLTAIYGYAEFLQKAAVTEDDRLSALDYIMAESRRIQTMAYQLLELADLANNDIEWESHNVPALFYAVQQTLQSKLVEKEIHFDIQCEVEEIRGDACLLQSLFVNLIDNAIKACEKGGRILVHVFAEAGKKIVTIQDNGKGMPADALGQITEPFYRVEKSRNRKDGGAGLGLAICKQIASRHAAELSFASRLDEGTTVTITFTTS